LADAVGIGSALLDLTYIVDDDTLGHLNLKKGHMHLIDEDASRKILKHLEKIPAQVTPGGSAANTMAGVACLGGSAVMIGVVGTDDRGDTYINESKKAGVDVRISRHNSMTGHAITMITPDSERTFATHLGAALNLSENDILEKDIKGNKVLHIEGYLLDGGGLKKAAIRAMDLAKRHNLMVSVDLADPSLITRNLDEFKRLVKEYADIVFVNEEEARVFTNKTEAEALNIIYESCRIAVVKLGASGSLIKSDGKIYNIQANRVSVVNTNGAGDMYAAGILYGLANNMPIEKAGKVAAYASSLVVSQVGARLGNGISVGDLNI
jgi:sugar/nucleoside kinase (ribokinase family)